MYIKFFLGVYVSDTLAKIEPVKRENRPYMVVDCGVLHP